MQDASNLRFNLPSDNPTHRFQLVADIIDKLENTGNEQQGKSKSRKKKTATND